MSIESQSADLSLLPDPLRSRVAWIFGDDFDVDEIVGVEMMRTYDPTLLKVHGGALFALADAALAVVSNARADDLAVAITGNIRSDPRPGAGTVHGPRRPAAALRYVRNHFGAEMTRRER